MLSSKFETIRFKKSINNTCTIIAAFRLQKKSYSSEPNIVRSKVPDINIPQLYIDEYIWKDLHKWHNKTALVCAETGRNYLFSDVYQKSRALANFLHNFPNLNQNDTVAVIVPNVPEYPIIMLGAFQAGLKVTPVNWSNTPDEITRQLLSSETKLIFTLDELWPKISQCQRRLNINIPIVVVNNQQNQSAPSGAIKFNEAVSGDHDLQFQIERNVNDTVLLPYSSGTTGVPKGVELTTKSIVSNLHQMGSSSFKLHNTTEGCDQETIPVVLPLFHIYGLIMTLFSTLASGCKLVTVPKFGTQVFIKVLREYQPTFMHLVPPIVLFLTNHPEVQPELLSSVRTIVSGAAPLGSSDIEKLEKKSNGKINIVQAYGLTEASPLTHTQTTKIPNGIKVGSSGLALPNTECKIVEEHDETKVGLGPNKSGELIVRGPQVMKGYYKNEEATRGVLDSDGWLRTGDIGHYDEDGHFYITDRLKELIKVKGFQVAPAELEQILRAYPDIEDAGVVGVPHEKFGEVPKAFVVAKPDTTIDHSKVHEYVAAKAATYKQLVGGIVVVDTIPRSQAGKILRRQLKLL